MTNLTIRIEVRDGEQPKVEVKPARVEKATAPVTCNDGSTSASGGKSGACAWHGGVQR